MALTHTPDFNRSISINSVHANGFILWIGSADGSSERRKCPMLRQKGEGKLSRGTVRWGIMSGCREIRRRVVASRQSASQPASQLEPLIATHCCETLEFRDVMIRADVKTSILSPYAVHFSTQP